MEKKESMVFYRSFYEAIKDLKLEQQAQIYNTIFSYWLNYEEIELDWICKTIFTLVKPQIDANQKRYESWKKGGRPKKTNGSWNKKPMVSEKEENKKPNVNVNDNDNEKDNDNVNENNNSPPQKFEEEKIKKIDNNSNLKNEYIMKMRDAETRWKFMIKKWNEKRPDKKQFTMSDDLKKLIASFLDIWSIEEFETAIENLVFIISNPYYWKRQTKYSLEHWDFWKFLENIGMFQDEKEVYQKIIWSIWFRQTFRKKEEEELPEFKDRHEEMAYYEKKKKKEKEEYKWFTSQYWNPLKQI